MLVNLVQLFLTLFTVTTVLLDLPIALHPALLSISSIGSASIACWKLGSSTGFLETFDSLIETVKSAEWDEKYFTYGMYRSFWNLLE